MSASTEKSTLKPFVLLSDPDNYVACRMELTGDEQVRDYWVDFFIKHIELLLSMGVSSSVIRGEPGESARRRADSCRVDFVSRFENFLANPKSNGPVTILTLDCWRDEILRRHGFVDCMIDLKDAENAKALKLLKEVVGEVDLHRGVDQLLVLIEGVFAGNLFDMGAKATAEQFADGQGPGFFATRGGLKPRPWLIDDFDAFADRMMNHRHKKAIYFIDNAGSDFLLGAIVLIRWMARRGTRVIIAANERPTLNDMTIHDVKNWWPKIVHEVPDLTELPIEFASTGTGEPLIDLLGVSDELNEISRDADLIILEGMGRGVETNLDARFKCDALNLAMLKDELIASRIGGTVFDCVCRFRSAQH